MASAERHRTLGLIERLVSQPEEFGMLQAVRLLAIHADRLGVEADLPGEGVVPEREFVRFQTAVGLAFPYSDVIGARAPEGESSGFDLELTCLGLLGSAGVLPQHYTEHVLERRSQKDLTFKDFVDALQMRSIAMHVMAAWKSRPGIQSELSALRPGRPDPFTEVLRSLIGVGPGSLRGRRSLPDRFLLHFSGHYARRVRTVAALESLLGELVGAPVSVEEWGGIWLDVPTEERGRLGESGPGRLGLDLLVGERVFHVGSMVHIRIGPLSLWALQRLAPGSEGRRTMLSAVDSYLEPGMWAQLSLELARSVSPGVRLGSDLEAAGTRLGHDSWLENEPHPPEARTATFSLKAFDPVKSTR